LVTSKNEIRDKHAQLQCSGAYADDKGNIADNTENEEKGGQKEVWARFEESI